MNRTLLIVFGTILTLLLVIFVCARQSEGQLLEHTRMVAETGRTIDQLEALDSSLANAELMERSYIGTGDTRYLEQYRLASRQIDELCRTLRTITLDSPAQQRQLDIATPLIRTRIRQFDGEIAAMQVNESLDGGEEDRRIRSALNDIRNVEKTALNEGNAKVRHGGDLNELFLTLTGGFSALIIVAIGFYLQRQMALRQAAQLALSKANDRLEQQVAERTEQLRSSNKDLEQFAYIASHDLQEPLRMISSYLGLIQQRHGHAFDDKTQDYFRFAVNGADRMRTMIKSILEYSRAQNQEVQHEAVDVDEVTQETIRTLSRKISDAGASVSVDGRLPTVIGNRVQIAQLLQNLLSNALKFCDGRKPVIRIHADADGDHWHFSVSDNGIGIDPAEQQGIFQVFHRLHNAAEFPGTGIGLATCKKIVERHGGRIWVESTPGVGSTFHFTMAKQPAANQVDIRTAM